MFYLMNSHDLIEAETPLVSSPSSMNSFVAWLRPVLRVAKAKERKKSVCMARKEEVISIQHKRIQMDRKG